MPFPLVTQPSSPDSGWFANVDSGAASQYDVALAEANLTPSPDADTHRTNCMRDAFATTVPDSKLVPDQMRSQLMVGGGQPQYRLRNLARNHWLVLVRSDLQFFFSLCSRASSPVHLSGVWVTDWR